MTSHRAGAAITGVSGRYKGLSLIIHLLVVDTVGAYRAAFSLQHLRVVTGDRGTGFRGTYHLPYKLSKEGVLVSIKTVSKLP